MLGLRISYHADQRGQNDKSRGPYDKQHGAFNLGMGYLAAGALPPSTKFMTASTAWWIASAVVLRKVDPAPSLLMQSPDQPSIAA